MRIAIIVFKLLVALLISLSIIIYYYTPASPSKLNTQCLINVIEESDNHIPLWTNKHDSICGVKSSEWGERHFEIMHTILSKEIRLIESAPDYTKGNESHENIQRLSTAITEIPSIKAVVAKHQPGLVTAVLVWLFWFMIISIKLFRILPRQANGDGYNGNVSARNKKFGLYRADRKQCATCIYWSGNRELNSQNTQFKVELNDALCKVSQMTRDPITHRTRVASTKNTPPNFGLNCKYHKHLSS